MVWTTSTVLALLIGIFGGVGASTVGFVIKSKSTSSKANKLLENAKKEADKHRRDVLEGC